MTVAICQPYLAAYAGYFRLFVAADVFVVLDDVQFPRRGWVHRYKDAKGKWVTLPLQKAPRDTRICDMKMMNGEYLNDFVTGWVVRYARNLGLLKSMYHSTMLLLDPKLKGQERIIAICKKLGATKYVNPSGGRKLYDATTFAHAGIELGFLEPYTGSYDSIRVRLDRGESPSSIREEIIRETIVRP